MKKRYWDQQRIARKIYQVHTAAEVCVKLEYGRVRSYFRLSRRIAGSFQEQWVLIGLDVCDWRIIVYVVIDRLSVIVLKSPPSRDFLRKDIRELPSSMEKRSLTIWQFQT